MLECDRAQFLWKIHFCLNLDKKDQKNGILHLSENSVIYFSQKQ